MKNHFLDVLLPNHYLFIEKNCSFDLQKNSVDRLKFKTKVVYNIPIVSP